MPKNDTNPDAAAENEHHETVPENRAPATVANLDNITSALADASPTPNEAAIQAEAEKTYQRNAQFADLRDSRGNRFDPDVHVTDSEGTPKTTIKGKLRLKPGRKSGSESASAQKGFVAGTAKNTSDATSLTPAQKQQARVSGEAAASALFMTGVVIGGDEWQPKLDEQHGIDERALMNGAFGDYFEAKNMTDIPPGVALCMAICAYAMPRFTMPKTQSRTKLFVAWARNKIASAKRSKNNGAQSDIRDDGKRQNNVSEKTGGKSKKQGFSGSGS